MNVMVDADGHARIAGFGLVSDPTDATTDGATPWTAPEILEGRGVPSKEADIFAFAMVIVEVGWGDPSVADLRLIARTLR